MVKRDLGCNPVHAYLGMSPIELDRTYSCVDMHRVELLREYSYLRAEQRD